MSGWSVRVSDGGNTWLVYDGGLAWSRPMAWVRGRLRRGRIEWQSVQHSNTPVISSDRERGGKHTQREVDDAARPHVRHVFEQIDDDPDAMRELGMANFMLLQQAARRRRRR